MVRVNPLQVLGTPEDTGMTFVLPSGHEGRVMSDGSVLDTVDGAFYSPEKGDAADAGLFAMRAEFDRRNGITVTDRMTIPVNVLAGIPYDFNCR